MLRDSRNFLLSASLYPMFVFSILWILLSGSLFTVGEGRAYLRGIDEVESN